VKFVDHPVHSVVLLSQAEAQYSGSTIGTIEFAQAYRTAYAHLSEYDDIDYSNHDEKSKSLSLRAYICGLDQAIKSLKNGHKLENGQLVETYPEVFLSPNNPKRKTVSPRAKALELSNASAVAGLTCLTMCFNAGAAIFLALAVGFSAAAAGAIA
jgi:hypothetical protein